MEYLDQLQHKRHELNDVNTTDKEAIQELKAYDDIWFKYISPYLFYKPTKHPLIELTIKRFKLVSKLNNVIELYNKSSSNCISQIDKQVVCNICCNKLICVAKGKVYCDKCSINDDIIFNKKGFYNPQKHFRSSLDYITGREDDIQVEHLIKLKNDIMYILNDKKNKYRYCNNL